MYFISLWGKARLLPFPLKILSYGEGEADGEIEGERDGLNEELIEGLSDGE